MSVVKKTKKVVEQIHPLTVSEFKSWISGVEDMQDGNWYPSPVQWNKIRSKISMLVETEQMNGVPINQYPQNRPNMVNYPTTPVPQYVSTTTLVPGTLASPVPLYSEIDLKTQNDAAEYTPAFM